MTLTEATSIVINEAARLDAFQYLREACRVIEAAQQEHETCLAKVDQLKQEQVKQQEALDLLVQAYQGEQDNQAAELAVLETEKLKEIAEKISVTTANLVTCQEAQQSAELALAGTREDLQVSRLELAEAQQTLRVVREQIAQAQKERLQLAASLQEPL